MLAFAILVAMSFVGFMAFQRGPKGSSYYSFVAHWLSPSQPVDVPDLVGARLEEAQAALGRQGLRLRISGRQFREGVPEGVVLSQDPPAGKKVKKPRTITVLLSGAEQRVEVPDLTGHTWEEAWAELKKLGLDVMDKPSYEASATVALGLVLRQDPPAGDRVRPGTRVSVVLSAGEENEARKSPDLRGQSLEDARQKLNEEGLPLFANIQRPAREAEGVVVAQEPAAEKPLGSGEANPFVLVLSRGPGSGGSKLVKVSIQGYREETTRIRVLYKDETGEHVALEGDYAKNEFDETEFEAEGETELTLEADGVVIYREGF